MLDRVSDPEDHTATDREKEALELVHTTKDALEKARVEASQALFDYAWESGWSAGYDQGWEAAFEHLRKQEAEMRTAAKAERPRSPAPPRGAQLPLPIVTRNLTASDMVFLFIKENPGQRGVDIANHFGAMSPPIPERTIRTALHRLKTFARKIMITEGKWYAVEDGQPPNEQANVPGIRRR